MSEWIHRLGSSRDALAVEKLWQRYYERLVRLARQKLGPSNRQFVDEEDVALSAFDGFCRGLAAGRYPRLNDRDDLWRLLVAITVNKAVDHRRKERRLKRGGGAVRDEAAMAGWADSQGDAGIAQIMGQEPAPELAASVADAVRHLLVGLGDEELRQIALLRLENYTVVEIARRLECSLRTVKRRLALIRVKWEETCR
ncbi:MAG: sigma-70 family RNA polymerase sigma factor [Pirellulales bacterium]